jgi:hypothetical protein
MLGWMRRRAGRKGRGALGALLNGTDEMWHPTALRAREDLDSQHQFVTPAPSPGDRLLDGSSVVLPARPVPADPPGTPLI